jgi:hypothetical protein
VTRNLLASVAETPQEQVLLTDVTSFRVTYYDGQEWRDSWDSTVEESILPEAVQIRIELARAADGYPRPPVELLVPVAVKPWPTPAATGSGSPSQAEVAVEPRNRSG